VHIEIDDAGTSARVDSRATLSAVAFGGQPKRDVRDVRLELTNIDGEWKISSLTVGEASGDLF
jgi:hypothetical protein